MAKKYDIDIDGYVGSWFSSKRFVKNSLSDLGDKEITCRINSLGGFLDDAIDIAAQFESHGKVTCELFALNASSATLLTLGAKKVRAHANSSYLIHKVLSWVDEWGYMNEDAIESTIERLKSEKDRSSTQTLIIAKMYAKKSGKPVKDILNLMKQEKWLTAEQAKEWGFVDEIFEDSTIQPANMNDPVLANMLNAAGLPVPVMKRVNPEQEKDDHSGFVKSVISGITDHFREIFNPQNNVVVTMNKTYVSVNTLLNMEGIEFKNGKVELTEDQVKTLNDAIVNAQAGKKTAEDALTGKDTEISNLKEEIKTLKDASGDETNPVKKETDTPPKEDNETNDFKSARDLYNMLP